MTSNNSHNAKKVLRRVREAFDLPNDGALADFLGIAQSTLSSWKSRDTLNHDLIIAKCKNESLDWIFRGESRNNSNTVKEDSTSYDDAEFSSIPFYAGIKASAGMGLVPQEDKPALEIKLRSYYINNTLRTQASDLFGIIAQGDSMLPDLENGDMVIIDQSKRNVREGRIYAVRIDEEVYLKKISPRPGGIYILRSSNPAYPEFEVKKEDPNFDVLGMAVNLSRTLI